MYIYIFIVLQYVYKSGFVHYSPRLFSDPVHRKLKTRAVTGKVAGATWSLGRRIARIAQAAAVRTAELGQQSWRAAGW